MCTFQIIVHSMSVLNTNSSTCVNQPPCARCSHKGPSPCWSSRGPPRWTDRPPRLSPLTSLHACTSVPSQHFMCWQTHTAELHFDSQSVILSLGSNPLAAHVKAGRRNSHRVRVTRAGGSCWRCASHVHKNVLQKRSFLFPHLYVKFQTWCSSIPLPLSHHFA